MLLEIRSAPLLDFRNIGIHGCACVTMYEVPDEILSCIIYVYTYLVFDNIVEIFASRS